MDDIKNIFSEYFSKHVKSVYKPYKNPYNGNINIKDYLEVTLNMEEWNIKYKRYPAKDVVKGLQVNFKTEELNDENNMQIVTGFIKNYRLCQYGYECVFILNDFSIKNME